MGAAKENRDKAAMRRFFDEQCAERENTKICRAQLWCDLIKDGMVLTFQSGRGLFTAGKYQTATGQAEFALLWCKPMRGQREILGSAWYVALMATDYCGRGRPIMADGIKI